VLVLLGFALALASCGDSDDGDQGADAAREDAAQADSATTDGSAEEQIEATLKDVRRAFNAGDGRGFCDHLSAAGERQVRQFGAAYDTGKECPAVVVQFSKGVERGQLPVEVESVEVTGDKAVAKTSGGLAGRGVGEVRFVQEEGEWRIANPLTAQNRGAQQGAS
jgi:hypothetical protein